MGRLAALTLMLLVLGTAPLSAQSVVGPFRAKLGGVEAMVEQPDGKLVVGGLFTGVDEQDRKHIVRLNVDGSLDQAFQAGANSTVSAVALQPDGKILIGGFFTEINGQPRSRLARLHADGTLDSTFSAGVDGMVSAIVVRPDGKILIGGPFGQVAGHARRYLAQLNANGTLDAGFRPNIERDTSGYVSAMVVQPDGKVLVGGAFKRVDGHSLSNLVRLDRDGARDSSFHRPVIGPVQSLALQPDGKILVGGQFTTVSIGFQTGPYIARLGVNGEVDTGFTSSLQQQNGPSLQSIVVLPDGKLVVGGVFNAGGSQLGPNVARLHADGSLDAGFGLDVNAIVKAIVRRATGRILIGGDFSVVNGSGMRTSLIQVTASGALESPLDVQVSSAPYAVAMQPDGKALIGGIFSHIGGQVRSHLARLNADLSLDAAFNPIVDGDVVSVSVLSDRKILIAGGFTQVNGQARRGIARLNADGTLDAAFNAAVNSWVGTVALQTDGKILIGGAFTQVGGQPRNSLARLQPDGSVDAGFNPNVAGHVMALMVLTNGKVMVGGDFTQVGGQMRQHLARLNTDGSVDAAFTLASDRPVHGLAYGPARGILLAGDFTQIGGVPRRYLAALREDGFLNSSFTPEINGTVSSMLTDVFGIVTIAGEFSQVNGQVRRGIAAWYSSGTMVPDALDTNGDVTGLAVDQRGVLLATGRFTQVNGVATGHVARLQWGQAGASSILSVSNDRSRLDWALSYNSPLLNGVWFEYASADEQWTRLGTATLARSVAVDTWTLSGLDLPRSSRVRLRARGYASGGYANASNSLIGTEVRVDLAERTPVSATVADGQGSVTPSTQDVALGEDVYFSLHPQAGWHVVSVTGTTCTPVDRGGGLWSAPNIQTPCVVNATFAQNALPQATSQTVPVAFNVAKAITLAGTDPHAGDSGFVYALATQPAHGTISGFDAATGTLTYTPTLGYSGSDRFTFTVRTISGTSLPAEVTLTIAAPTAVTSTPQSVDVTFNTNRQVAVSGIDPNPGGPYTRTYAIFTPPTHGAINNFNPASGLLTYVPPLGYSGTDSFTFTTTTVNGTSAPATVTLTIAPGQPLIAWNETMDVGFNKPKAITVYGNDPNRGGPFVFTYAIVQMPTQGTITGFDGATGTLTYTPASGYSGTDRFTFTATTINGTSPPGTVTLNIAAAELPTATAQSVDVAFNVAKPITLTGSDPNAGGPFAYTYALVAQPSHGIISGFDAATGTLTYTPASGYSGPDRFTFTATTSNGTSQPAEAILTIADPEIPTATAQSVTVAFNVATAITLAGNDPNPGGPFDFTYAVVDAPTHGTISGVDAATGTLTYTPTLGYSGADSFTFTAKTVNGTSVAAEASLTVAAGEPVTAAAQTVDVAFNVATAITLAGSDPNPGGPFDFTYALVAQPSHGTISDFDGATGTLTYTPTLGYTGADAFTFTVKTINGTSVVAEVTLAIAEGDPVTATAQSVDVAFNTAKAITLSGTDPNAGGPFALTYALATQPEHGAISGFDAATGALTYTPTSGYSGTDRFTFTVASVNGTSTAAEVMLSIIKPRLDLAIAEGAEFVQYGQLVEYVVTLSNPADMARAVPVQFTLSDGFDGDALQIDCLGGDSGANCVADGSIPLRYTITLPPGRELIWLLAVPVREDAEASEVTLTVSAFGATSVVGTSALVIFKDGFGGTGVDDTQPEPAVDAAQASDPR